VDEAEGGAALVDVIARTGVDDGPIEQSVRSGRVRRWGEWLVSGERVDGARKRLAEAAREFHQANPMLPGIPREDLRARAAARFPPALFDSLLEAEPSLIAEGETVRLRSHRPAFKEDEQAGRSKIEQAFRSAGLKAPPITETLASSGVDASRARTLLQLLLRERTLIRVSGDLVLHAAAVDELKRQLAQRKGQRFAVPEFKEWTGVSRKYAIPLLEFLDRERVTRREGDMRIVL
jgi:selenocysteine-specific elongation factor